MYFQKITVWISQCLLLGMRNLLAGWIMCFNHLKRKICGVCLQNCLTALKSFHRPVASSRSGDAPRLAVHMKEVGTS